MDMFVTAELNEPTRGRLRCGATLFDCALGRAGIKQDKREGDGATPCGRFPLRRVFYRADRLGRPVTDLPVQAIAESDGWCDAPDDSSYNTLITHPYTAGAEHLWRTDNRYNIVAVPGHNDDPVIPGAGSAIFLHVAADDLRATDGCVALRQEDLLTVLALCSAGSWIQIEPITS